VVRLSRIGLGDEETVMAWDADPDVQRWFDWPLRPATEETAGSRLASARKTVSDKQAAWEAGTEYTFIIRRQGSGPGLGWIGLQPRGSGRGNVSYGVLPDGRRQGLATRALVLVTAHAFEALGWARVGLAAIADNLASRAVAVKAGFTLEGVLRSYGAYQKHEPLLGRRFDWAIYSRLATDGQGTPYMYRQTGS
jgi:RimJ/RimL family protein N-acetyltransferase